MTRALIARWICVLLAGLSAPLLWGATAHAAATIFPENLTPTSLYTDQTWPLPATNSETDGVLSMVSTTTQYCTVAGGVLTALKPGTCSITMTSAAAPGFEVGHITKSITVQAWATALDLTLSTTDTAFGSAVTASSAVSAVSPDAPTLSGTVSYEGKLGTGPWTSLGTGQLATSHALAPFTDGGAWTIRASFVPTRAALFKQSSDQASLSLSAVTPQVTLTAPATAQIGDQVEWTVSVDQPALPASAPTPSLTLQSQTPTTCQAVGDLTIEYLAVGPCTVKASQAPVGSMLSSATSTAQSVVVARRTPIVTVLAVNGLKADTTGLLRIRVQETLPDGTVVALSGSVAVSVTDENNEVTPYQFPVVNGLGVKSFTSGAAGVYDVAATFTPNVDFSRYAEAAGSGSFSVALNDAPVTITDPPTSAVVGEEWHHPLVDSITSQVLTVGLVANSGDACAVDQGVVAFNHTGTCKVSFTRSAVSGFYTQPAPLLVTITVDPMPIQLAVDASTLKVADSRTLKIKLLNPDGATIPGTGSVTLCPLVNGSCSAPGMFTTVVEGSWSNGQATVRGTAKFAGPHEVVLAPSPEWDDDWAIPASATVDVSRGTPTLTLTNADELVAADTVWEARYRSNSPGTISLQATGACSLDGSGVSSSIAGGYLTKFSINAHSTGTCQLAASQEASDDWAALAPLLDQVTVTAHQTKVLVTNPAELLVDLNAAAAQQVIGFRGVRDGNHSVAGSITATLIAPDGTSVTTLEPLDQDDSGDLVTWTVHLPSEGRYQVHAWFTPANRSVYSESSALGDFNVSKQSQYFGQLPAVPAQAYVGSSWQPTLEILPEESTFTSDETALRVPELVVGAGSDACRVEHGKVVFAADGQCAVSLYSPETRAYQASALVPLGTVKVDRNPVEVSIEMPTSAVVGEPVTVSLEATSATTDNDLADGTYTITAGGIELPAVPATAGRAQATWTPQHAGTEVELTAEYKPIGSDPLFETTTSAPTTVEVTTAPTSVSVEVHGAEAFATVQASPAAGVPTGTVRFTSTDPDGVAIGTVSAALVNGSAQAPHALGVDRDGFVVAEYLGDDDRSPSEDDVERNKPLIGATVIPTAPATNGWFRAPVQVVFNCTDTTAPLATPCPAPVMLTRDGASLSVTGSVSSEDGAIATVTSTPVRIDRTAPKVSIAHVRAGAWYRGAAPRATCVGVDPTSGIASCTISTKKTSATDRLVQAVAVDRAGNRTATQFSYRVLNEWVQGAALTGNTFAVRRGKTITIVARTNGVRPQLMLPRRAGVRPRISGAPMVAASIEEGVVTWRARYRVPAKFRPGQLLQVGVKARNSGLRIVKLRIR